jgi:outer membrane protein TolC
MYRRYLSVTVLSLAVGACSVQPVALKQEEIAERIRQDNERMYAEQEPINGPLTLWEAMARSLKYNLDHRVKLMEIALSQRILDVSNFNMLPQLMVDAGYNARNNYSGGHSMSLLTGRESLEPSTSQDKTYYNIGLNLAWNILDFGVSHATANQKANDALIAQERRRRVIQNIIFDVREAYWQATVAQHLLEPTEKNLKDIESALERSRQMEQETVQSPEKALMYQKRLLETQRRLLKMREQMILAKTKMAALINLPPESDYQLAPPAESPDLPTIKESLSDLEQMALRTQPELLEEDYLKRNTVWEVKKAVRRMLPGIELSLGAEYNSNSFLYHDNWYYAGLKLSWNLFGLFSGQKEEAEAHSDLADARRMALSMAILSQVWVSYQRYQLSREDYRLAAEVYKVDGKLDSIMQRAREAQVRSQMDAVLTQAEGLASDMAKRLAYADVQSALAQVYHAVGVDPLPAEVSGHDIPTLSKEIQAYVEKQKL